MHELSRGADHYHDGACQSANRRGKHHEPHFVAANESAQAIGDENARQ
jgi:hypothetical protein